MEKAKDDPGEVALERTERSRRHAEGYPTTAQAIVPAESVVPVGEYDCREQVIRLTGPEGERLLAAWLGVEAVEPAELIARS